MITALYCWCKFMQLSCSLAVSRSVKMLRIQRILCAIYSYTNPFLLMDDILFCDWPMASFTSIFHSTCMQLWSIWAPFIYFYIAPFFFFELDRTQLSACMNLKQQNQIKPLCYLQIHILHVATFYEHYKAINEYSYSTIHIKPELIQYTR